MSDELLKCVQVPTPDKFEWQVHGGFQPYSADAGLFREGFWISARVETTLDGMGFWWEVTVFEENREMPNPALEAHGTTLTLDESMKACELWADKLQAFLKTEASR